MNKRQVTPNEFEKVLKNNFKNVVQYWDAGNFKGYIASDSEDTISIFTNNSRPTPNLLQYYQQGYIRIQSSHRTQVHQYTRKEMDNLFPQFQVRAFQDCLQVAYG